jgi:hypothetical protein
MASPAAELFRRFRSLGGFLICGGKRETSPARNIIAALTKALFVTKIPFQLDDG